MKDTRQPIPATKTHAKRVDYEYERAGTARIFMFTKPLAGWHELTVCERRTKVDWALEMTRLLEGSYSHCQKVILVCDNLNTHTIGAFYEALEPERARQLVRRIESRHTPKHGSWLRLLNEHRVENELSSLTRQCVADKRFGEIAILREDAAVWSTTLNETQRGVDGQMKITDARCKLKSVYPKIQT